MGLNMGFLPLEMAQAMVWDSKVHESFTNDPNNKL